MNDKKLVRKKKIDLINFFKENHLGMLTIDSGKKCIAVANPAACKLYQCKKEHLIGVPLSQLYITDKAALTKEIKQAIEECRRYLKMRLRTISGEEKEVLVYAASESLDEGDYFHLIISERTAQIKRTENLRKNEERLAFAIESSGDGVWDYDIAAGTLFYSKQWSEILGLESEKETVSPLADWEGRIHPEERERVLKEFHDHISGKTPVYHSEYQLEIEKGRYIWLLDRGKVAEWDEKGNPTRVVGIDSDITGWKSLEQQLKKTVEELKQREQEILHLSLHDDLTGLPNRRLFNKKLEELNQPEKMPLTIMLGDINGLKLTNDVFGHTAGDEILKKAAVILLANIRETDFLARCGGDEFIILMPNTSEKEAEQVMNRIRHACELKSQEDRLSPSISLGLSTKYSTEVDSLFTFKLAEDMMYTGKLLENRSYRSGLVHSMISSLQEKSHETQLHAMRLKEASMDIARAMNIPEHLLGELELFSMLHDIGKIAIRDSVLEKPGPLDETEWIEMRRHSEIGYHIAKSASDLVHIAELILCHHERWDGNGYPRKIKGEDIPLFSRIIAVVDAYDAMISDRPYRKALPEESALAEICRGAATQFDPKIVEIFLEQKRGTKP